MKRCHLYIIGLMSLLSILSCKEAKPLLKPVHLEMFALYTRDMLPAEQKNFHELYYAACVLHVNESNKFQLTDRDIEKVEIYTNQQHFHFNLAMKQVPAQKFREFTTRNSNSYVAIVINDSVNNVARIQEPISDGKVQFVIGTKRLHEITTLLNLFFPEPPLISGAGNGSIPVIKGL